MIYTVEGIPVYFPYDSIYAEQKEYIQTIVSSLIGGGHVLLEMPSGTGKTISLLASSVSYLIHAKAHKRPFKIVYCARTVSEVDKTIQELKGLHNYISSFVPDFSFIGLGLTARSSMCINPHALAGNVELMCRKMVNRLENLKCDFYESPSYVMPPGVYDFSDLHGIGQSQGVCPYYLVRSSIASCDCIVYTYNYLIDPSVYSSVSHSLPPDSLVIFDEAHNIDAHCIEALSAELTRGTLEAAARAVKVIEEKLEEKDDNAIATDDARLATALRTAPLEQAIEDSVPFYPLSEKRPELCPGNLRNTLHFTGILKRLIEFFKTKLKTTHLTTETIKGFVESIKDLTFINRNTLKFCSQRLAMITRSFENEEVYKLKQVADFATLLGIYTRGFSVIFEPYENGVFNPILRLCCLDASLAISHVFSKFRNVVITSGTLSPVEMYPKILNFVPGTIATISTTLDRDRISPLIITKGNDQMVLRAPCDDEAILERIEGGDKMTSSFSFRKDPSVVRNYGSLLISLTRTVPDNIVCFFPSYIYMEEIVTTWSETDVIKEIMKKKLLFIETPDARETALAVEKFKGACDCGRGAVLLSVARGKMSEGMDFDHGYGRAVVLMGVPFMYTESVRLRARLAYLKDAFGIKEYDFLLFDAARHAAQCLGRGLRNKSDYGLMIMADSRFGACAEKLPKWIKGRIQKGHTGLSIDMAMHIAKAFYREMAQGGEEH